MCNCYPMSYLTIHLLGQPPQFVKVRAPIKHSRNTTTCLFTVSHVKGLVLPSLVREPKVCFLEPKITGMYKSASSTNMTFGYLLLLLQWSCPIRCALRWMFSSYYSIVWGLLSPANDRHHVDIQYLAYWRTSSFSWLIHHLKSIKYCVVSRQNYI